MLFIQTAFFGSCKPVFVDYRCLNKESFQVVFDDKDKQRWIFMGKAQQSGCKRKKCKKSRPRLSEEFYEIEDYLSVFGTGC